VDYPDFDITRDFLPERFDFVVADQVLEHVIRPVDAVRNMATMLNDGGYVVIATPFLFRVHGRPYDYFRWTPPGLRQMLIDGGFPDSDIETHAWGNKACAKAHIGGPVRDLGFGRDLSNDDDYPMVVWAFAKKRW
jgi:SAM-dependent methyltransferase